MAGPVAAPDASWGYEADRAKSWGRWFDAGGRRFLLLLLGIVLIPVVIGFGGLTKPLSPEESGAVIGFASFVCAVLLVATAGAWFSARISRRLGPARKRVAPKLVAANGWFLAGLIQEPAHEDYRRRMEAMAKGRFRGPLRRAAGTAFLVGGIIPLLPLGLSFVVISWMTEEVGAIRADFVLGFLTTIGVVLALCVVAIVVGAVMRAQGDRQSQEAWLRADQFEEDFLRGARVPGEDPGRRIGGALGAPTWTRRAPPGR